MKKLKEKLAAVICKISSSFKRVSEHIGNMNRAKKIVLSIATVFLEIILLLAIMIFTVSASVKKRECKNIISSDEASSLEDIDCIIVLGAGVQRDGTPSHMLEDRLAVGVELYKQGTSDIILMSGDHSKNDYNEVGAMLTYAENNGVPSEAIFCDHAGVCTYDSIYRAKEIFGAHRVLIVTQEYHLYRALYIAESLGLEAYGVSASLRSYTKQGYRDLREVVARFKDFYTTIFELEPKFLGEKIPLGDDGRATH